MNKTILCSLLIAIAVLSCSKGKSQEEIAAQTREERPVKVNCYIAFYDKDTINLEINTLKSGKIAGIMEMKLINMPIKSGKIDGEFRGDTLFVDYSFIQGENTKVVFKNPMAFLKNGSTLILGNGKIITYLGASYFAKGEPIDFESVKYKFNEADCQKR